MVDWVEGRGIGTQNDELMDTERAYSGMIAGNRWWLWLNHGSMDGWGTNRKWMMVWIYPSRRGKQMKDQFDGYPSAGWIMNGGQVYGGWVVHEWGDGWQINGWVLGGRVMGCVPWT